MSFEIPPSVSIIILNFNGKEFLNKCLESVFKTEYQRFEVVLVDNASVDGSLKTLSDPVLTDGRLKIVQNSANLGYGLANNIGYENAVGDYVVFLNNDTVVHPRWLGSLVSVMEKDSTIGLVQSLILNMDGGSVQTAGWLISDYFNGLFSIHLNKCELKNLYPPVFEISYASGAAMMIKKDLVSEIGLFDPKYFWFYDDNFLSFKVWLAGKRVVTAKDSIVYHAGGGTAGVDSFFIRHHGTICLVSLVFDAYWRFLDLARALFLFYYNLGITSIKEIIEKRVTTRFWTNISATVWVLRNLRHIWANRLKFQRMARVSQETLLSNLIRVHAPASVYLVPPPSKLLWNSLNRSFKDYQSNLIKLYQSNQK